MMHMETPAWIVPAAKQKQTLIHPAISAGLLSDHSITKQQNETNLYPLEKADRDIVDQFLYLQHRVAHLATSKHINIQTNYHFPKKNVFFLTQNLKKRHIVNE